MGPFTTAVPDSTLTGFMSMQVISQDHYTTEVAYGPGAFTYTKDNVGTRYVYIHYRNLADPEKTEDIKVANAVQDAIKVEQASAGKFEVPDPFDHLIGTAIGWGGNPRNATDYQSFYPTKNDGTTVHRLTVKDIPVDGFWSVSVYDAKGFFEKNPLDAYSLNNLTARPSADGSVTVQFGGCGKDTPNCLPIVQAGTTRYGFIGPARKSSTGLGSCQRRSRSFDGGSPASARGRHDASSFARPFPKSKDPPPRNRFRPRP